MLARILDTKRREVALARAARPLAALEAAARAGAPVRSLRAALARTTGEPLRVLAEIKRASPSAGAIRPGADPAAIAFEYAEAGAAAISVLTDREYFDGELAFLAQCRERVTIPLLRKDFIIDSYQVAETRAAGGDAVLLIVAAVAPAELAELLAAAGAFGLDALVEVHDRREADLAIAAGATLVGINHRDLRTFTIDLELTAQITPGLPPGIVIVSESGIRTPGDLRRLDAAGAHGVLIGESLMRAPSPGRALVELTDGLRGAP